jgi:hypothetical protein
MPAQTLKLPARNVFTASRRYRLVLAKGLGAVRACIPKLKRNGLAGLLIATIIPLVSCASDKQPVGVVKDSDTQRESAIPWNEQQKWEVGSEMSQIATERAQH